ncbi:DUF2637 domain-containing protein [Nocardia arizonensis]|uniref:DUF2637 domain-containing protein n=1 Tax=Nocardia arizonensis TaxID=1141647 RepID=UPI0006CF9D60|nr:DUF2637 domain-containing protein [Nocardia arizonensis]
MRFPHDVLLAAVHGVSVLLRAHAAAHTIQWIATAMTAFIAAGAFWLSFTALRSLAIAAGVPHGEAWLWPLIIEGSMAESTVALIALAHSAQGEDRAHATTEPTTDLAALECRAPHNDQVQLPPVDIAVPVHTSSHELEKTDHDFSTLAAALCARNPARRRDPGQSRSPFTRLELPTGTGSFSRDVIEGSLLFTRPAFPSPVTTGWNGSAWASPRSFAPRRYRRRTSRWGQIIGHWPGTTLTSASTPTPSH